MNSTVANRLTEFFDSVWEVFSQEVQTSITSDKDVTPALVPEILKQFSHVLGKGTVPGDAANALVIEVVKAALDKCATLLSAEETNQAQVTSLVNILNNFGELVFSNAQIAEVRPCSFTRTRHQSVDNLRQGVDELVQSQTYRLLKTLPTLLLLYLRHRDRQEACLSVWHSVLESLARHTDEIDILFPPLLDAADGGYLPAYLRPQGEELHEVASHLLTDALSGPPNASSVSLIHRLLTSYSMSLMADARCGGLTDYRLQSRLLLAAVRRISSGVWQIRLFFTSTASCTTIMPLLTRSPHH